MRSSGTEAERLLERGNGRDVATLAARLIKPRADNLVERPWGGARLRAFKRLDAPSGSQRPVGESFELAADDRDEEARRYPSVIELGDGSTVTLPELLEAHGRALLGADFIARYGARLPLLPKLLDVAELLSMQAHPAGNTEVYVIVAADAGATIRVGFNADIDAKSFAERLVAGRAGQQRLCDLAAEALAADELQAVLKPWLAARDAVPSELEPSLGTRLAATAWAQAEPCLTMLHEVYWQALDCMNAIPVRAGQVIYNANPTRVTAASGKPTSAEVHALGNPEGRAMLALEIRRPGPTLRAWDNVRFPLRDIDIDAALSAVNLSATEASDFIVTPQLVRPGVRRSVDCEYFRVEHLEPTATMAIDVPAAEPHSLHALDGAMSVFASDGLLVGRLERGESALVPLGVGAYRIVADREPAALVKVEIPPYAC